jgi:hypothetical protein
MGTLLLIAFVKNNAKGCSSLFPGKYYFPVMAILDTGGADYFII